MEDSSSRRAVVRDVFHALEKFSRGYLTAQDMRPFANHTGFDGNDQDWAEEFKALSAESGNPQGIPLAFFERLVDDESDNGCYCTDAELKDLLAKLPKAALKPPPATMPPPVPSGPSKASASVPVAAQDN